MKPPSAVPSLLTTRRTTNESDAVVEGGAPGAAGRFWELAVSDKSDDRAGCTLVLGFVCLAAIIFLFGDLMRRIHNLEEWARSTNAVEVKN
jgi:hypothetical protein